MFEIYRLNEKKMFIPYSFSIILLFEIFLFLNKYFWNA